jgi:hypothetical protein
MMSAESRDTPTAAQAAAAIADRSTKKGHARVRSERSCPLLTCSHSHASVRVADTDSRSHPQSNTTKMATDTSPITRSSDELRHPPFPIRKIPQPRIIKVTLPSENSPEIFQRISYVIRNLNTSGKVCPWESSSGSRSNGAQEITERHCTSDGHSNSQDRVKTEGLERKTTVVRRPLSMESSILQASMSHSAKNSRRSENENSSAQFGRKSRYSTPRVFVGK